MSINLYTKRHIEFKTVETATAWVTFAVLIEQCGDETTVSEPRVIKVVAKKASALPGSVAVLGTVPTSTEISYKKSFVSPYSTIFSYNDGGVLAWCGAQPPTF